MKKASAARGNTTSGFAPFPIDAVITWVDGNDPRHMAKRLKYGNDDILHADDVAGSTRYASVGEILSCNALFTTGVNFCHIPSLWIEIFKQTFLYG